VVRQAVYEATAQDAFGDTVSHCLKGLVVGTFDGCQSVGPSILETTISHRGTFEDLLKSAISRPTQRRQSLILNGEMLERSITARFGPRVPLVERDAPETVTSLCRLPFPCEVDQNLAHQAGRPGEEVPPVLPQNRLGIDQPEVALVDEAGHLQGVIGSLPFHVPAGHLPQFCMHERGHDGEGFLVAPVPGVEQRANGDEWPCWIPDGRAKLYVRCDVRFPDPFPPIGGTAVLSQRGCACCSSAVTRPFRANRSWCSR
jgi:hypothetical protein